MAITKCKTFHEFLFLIGASQLEHLIVSLRIMINVLGFTPLFAESRTVCVCVYTWNKGTIVKYQGITEASS